MPVWIPQSLHLACLLAPPHSVKLSSTFRAAPETSTSTRKQEKLHPSSHESPLSRGPLQAKWETKQAMYEELNGKETLSGDLGAAGECSSDRNSNIQGWTNGPADTCCLPALRGFHSIFQLLLLHNTYPQQPWDYTPRCVLVWRICSDTGRCNKGSPCHDMIFENNHSITWAYTSVKSPSTDNSFLTLWQFFSIQFSGRKIFENT